MVHYDYIIRTCISTNLSCRKIYINLGRICHAISFKRSGINKFLDLVKFQVLIHDVTPRDRTRQIDKIRQLFKDTWKFVESEYYMESKTWRDLLCRMLHTTMLGVVYK